MTNIRTWTIHSVPTSSPLAELVYIRRSKPVNLSWETYAGTTYYDTYNTLAPVVKTDRFFDIYKSEDVWNDMVPTYWCLPKSVWSYSRAVYLHPLDLFFNNVCSINGRSVNCKIQVNSVTAEWANCHGESDSSHWTVASRTFPVFGLYHSSESNFWATSGLGYEIQSDISISLTYADTGAVVDLPFYQGFFDLDVSQMGCITSLGNPVWPESVILKEGYDRNVYRFNQGIETPLGGWLDYEEFSGNQGFQISAVPTSNGDEDTGTSYIDTACFATMSSGSCDLVFQEYSCGTKLTIYSPYIDKPGSPEKEVDNSHTYYAGDAVSWDVSYTLPRYGSEIFRVYTSFAITDTLDKDLEYVSARLYHNGRDVTGIYGAVSHDQNSRTVTYTIKPSVYSQASKTFYDGGVLKLTVNTRIRAESQVESIPNKGVVHISGIQYDTKPVTITVEPLYKITTEVVHGTITETKTGLRPGSSHTVSYAPEAGHYLESVTVDGTAVNIGDYPSSYAFSNIQADHDIKVVYTPYFKVTTEVVNGTITPDDTTIKKGENRTVSYAPKNRDYYLKSLTVDGTALTKAQLVSHPSSYGFSNIQADHHVKAVYAKVPAITITKAVTGDVVWAKGKPEFTFAVTGMDYLGNRKTYYRTILFSKEDAMEKSITLKIPAGTWTVSELPSNDWSFVSIIPGDNCTTQGQSGVLNTLDSDHADVRFTNKCSDWSDYTENGTMINPLQ